MKKIFLIVLTLQAFNCFGQNWHDIAVDNTLTVCIPDNYQIVDTLGQRIITCQVDNGLIYISKVPNLGKIAVEIYDEKGLIDYYKGLQNGVIESSKGNLLSFKSSDLNKLKLIKFSFKVKLGVEMQIHDCLGLFLNGNTYLIQFWHLDVMTKELEEKRDKLFSSLKTSSDFTIKNQLTDLNGKSSSYRNGYIFGKIFAPVLILIIFIYLLIWISKIKRRRKSTNAQQAVY